MKQMCWLDQLGNDGTKILHLRENPSDFWRVYTLSPHRVPDYMISNGSKGYATMQKLLKLGWELVPTKQAEAEIKTVV